MNGDVQSLPAVSILLISRERRAMLHALIESLRQQDYAGEFEIVVVEETDEPQAPNGVTYVPHPMKNLGIAYARNLSVAHASHGILAFIDDDCQIEKNWLQSLVSPMQDTDVMGVQGGVIVPEHTNGIGWAESILGFPGGGVSRVIQAKGQVQATQEISTLNACYRKNAVEQAGGFSKHARFGGEDFLLARKVATMGKLLFVPQAVVRHEARGNLADIWQWFVRRGRAEWDLWQSGLAPDTFGSWMIKGSQSLKLLPFLVLCHWSVWPLVIYVLATMGINLWRYRWVLHEDIPFSAWLWLPVVRLTMSLASDYGRLKAWLSKD